MKAIQFSNFNHPKNLWVVAMLALVVVSCSKSDDGYYNLPEGAAVGIVHASTGLPALDIALDNNRLGVNYFNYTDRIAYFRAYTGNRELKVYNAGAASANPIFTKGLNFEAGKYYTVFIVDTAAKMDAVSLRDSTRAAGQDSVRLRFANMSPDAPGIDLYVKGQTTPVATNITYKKASNFISYKATANIVFEIKATGQNTLLASLEPFNLTRNNSLFYTIWCGGYVNGNEAANKRIDLSWYAH